MKEDVRGACGATIVGVPVSMRCPRCKEPLQASDPDVLADRVLEHLRREHGHKPPREHVLARITHQNQDPDDH